MISRRQLLFQTLSSALRRRPNLVVLLADDLGYGDIGCYGSPVPTPHIDSIARRGVRFTDGYVSAAVCSPSRAALLTGLYQQRLGHEFNSGPVEREAQIGFGLPKSAAILPQMLAPHGYRSAAFGKWHLGAGAGYHPLDRGFDEFVGFLPGANNFVTRETPGAQVAAVRGEGEQVSAARQHSLYRNRDKFEDHGHLTETLGREAAAFIDRNKTRPFFLYLPFNAVHTPLESTGAYVDRVAAITDPKKRMLAAMTVAMDDAVGVVLSALKAANLDRDTLVVFLSDNGSPIVTGAGSNGALKGEKVTYYEGGIRVPFAMRWLGRIPEGRLYSEMVVSRDIVPTFLAAAGVPAPRQLDGVNLLPFVQRATGGGVPHDALYWRAGTGRAVRMGRWKLVEHDSGFTGLYDLRADIGERKNLAETEPKVVEELRAAWKAWSREMAAPAWPARSRDVVVNGQRLHWQL